MIVTIDLNVVLDVFLQRGEYIPAAEVFTLCERKSLRANIPSHGIPTIYYILKSRLGRNAAISIIDDLLDLIEVVPVGISTLRAVRTMPITDFEDAIVAASALQSASQLIITNNLRDFRGVPMTVVTAENFVRDISPKL